MLSSQKNFGINFNYIDNFKIWYFYIYVCTRRKKLYRSFYTYNPIFCEIIGIYEYFHELGVVLHEYFDYKELTEFKARTIIKDLKMLFCG
jgi:hypothetical protein